jgi:hypothetical protein
MGRVALPWLRGRAGLPVPAQAAQHAARSSLGLLGVDDLPVRAVHLASASPEGVERWEVTLGGPAGAVVVTLASRPSDAAAHLTCRALHPAHSRVWDVESIG